MCAGPGILTKGVGAQAPRRCPGSDARALSFVRGMLPKVPRRAAPAQGSGGKAPLARPQSPKMLHGPPLLAESKPMSARNRILAAAALLLLLAAAGWWFGSPWWTLWRMREAAQAGNSDALAAYIDVPALRASTRASSAHAWDRSATPSPAPRSTPWSARRRCGWRWARAGKAAAA